LKRKTYQQNIFHEGDEYAYHSEARCLCSVIQILNDSLHCIEKQMNAIVESKLNIKRQSNKRN
jgi:hypothetical protein